MTMVYGPDVLGLTQTPKKEFERVMECDLVLSFGQKVRVVLGAFSGMMRRSNRARIPRSEVAETPALVV
ncbi:MAG: hypothetical protein M2R45_02608 [Verrucomicrobia subdivision 3 bacterium]|nr:hypothetical protein [Limisphaerales bacterium]MCS1416424.1 hypothetical protein [Limisphaerales bacterium]